MAGSTHDILIMKPTPVDWPRLSAAVYYNNAGAMIDWLVKAFGFRVRIRIYGDAGGVEHSELEYGEALIMVSDARFGDKTRFGIATVSPLQAEGNTQNLMLFVDDVDAHCEIARATGATIAAEPKDYDYGEQYWTDRSYGAIDPEQHLWWFTQRIRDQLRP